MIQKYIYTIQYIYYTDAPATSQYAIVCKTQQYMYLLLHYISAVYTDSPRPMDTTVCMYGHHI